MQKVLHLHRNCFLRIFYAPESVIILINLTTSHWNWSGFYSIVFYISQHITKYNTYLCTCMSVSWLIISPLCLGQTDLFGRTLKNAELQRVLYQSCQTGNK
jgi:hypothetical protein